MQYEQKRRRVIGAYAVIVIAVFGLLGYLPGMHLLGSIREEYIPMAPSTAVSFIVLGSILLLLNRSPFGRIKKILSLFAIMLVSLFGVLDVAGYVMGMDLNFEHTIIPEAGTLHGIPIARMSPATGAFFSLSGITLFFILLRHDLSRRRILVDSLISTLSMFLLLGSFLFCIAYLYGTPFLYGRGTLVPMALTTAIGFLCLAYSLITSARDLPLLRQLEGSSTRSYLLRSLLPLSVISVILGGAAVIFSAQSATLNPAFLSAALTVMIIIVSALAATIISRHLGSRIDRSSAELKKTNAALQESEAHLRTLIETLPELIWLKDPEGVYLSCNRHFERFFGAEEAEIIGKTDYDFVDRELADFFRKNDMAAMQAGKPTINEEEVTYADDGHHEILETIKTPMIDSNGNLVGILGIARDITARKKMEAALKEQEELMIAQSRQAAMGDMIAIIAHQWRQPITVVAMAANNIKLNLELGEEPTKEALYKMVDTVTKQTQYLSKTIDDFRNFFRPDNKMHLENVCTVIDNAVSIVGKTLENNNIQLVFTKKCEKNIHTYANEFLQVLINLITNAKDALKNTRRPDARISISVFADETHIKTVICDNGGGIPDTVIKQIGEPYVSTKVESGTGLGLYMSKIIVEKHLHGTFNWENRDGGACFSIILPLDPDAFEK